MDEVSLNTTVGTPPSANNDQLVGALIALGVLFILLTVLVITGFYWFHQRLIRLNRKIAVLEGDWKFEREQITLATTNKTAMRSTKTYSGNSAGYVSGIEETEPDKVECTLWGQRGTILGSPRILSQAYAISQDHFSKTFKRLQIKTTAFKIVAKKFTEELPDGHLGNDVTKSGHSNRPTSVVNLLSQPVGGTLEEEFTTQPYTAQKELFKQESIDGSGGSIVVSGVRLSVPPGALDTATTLTIGVSWDVEKYPVLNKKQALLSPIIVCEPTGVIFKKPVELSFPHCAKDILKDWMPMLLQSSSQINAPIDWKQMTIADYTERKFTDSRVIINIKHFTLYALTGESKAGMAAAKDIKILAFAPPLKGRQIHKVRIYCVENYKNEIEEILDEERSMDGRRVHPKMPLFLHDNGENLTVENRLVSDGWNLKGNPRQEMAFELIWHGKTPSQQFVFSNEQDVTVFITDFVAFQNKREQEFQELHIADEAEKVERTTVYPSTGLVPRPLRTRLISLLEPLSPLGNDWQTLADAIGLDGEDIRYLSSKSSPMDELLNRWECNNTDLNSLHEILEAMDRPDAASEVRPFLKQGQT